MFHGISGLEEVKAPQAIWPLESLQTRAPRCSKSMEVIRGHNLLTMLLPEQA